MNAKQHERVGYGVSVRIKNGASAWMKQRRFWLKDWPDSIDGMDFVAVADYTHLGGDSSHWLLENETVKDCGVHPQWLATNDKLTHEAGDQRL